MEIGARRRHGPGGSPAIRLSQSCSDVKGGRRTSADRDVNDADLPLPFAIAAWREDEYLYYSRDWTQYWRSFPPTSGGRVWKQ